MQYISSEMRLVTAHSVTATFSTQQCLQNLLGKSAEPVHFLSCSCVFKQPVTRWQEILKAQPDALPCYHSELPHALNATNLAIRRYLHNWAKISLLAGKIQGLLKHFQGPHLCWIFKTEFEHFQGFLKMTMNPGRLAVTQPIFAILLLDHFLSQLFHLSHACSLHKAA